jgi:hypothetical protein
VSEPLVGILMGPKTDLPKVLTDAAPGATGFGFQGPA